MQTAFPCGRLNKYLTALSILRERRFYICTDNTIRI